MSFFSSKTVRFSLCKICLGDLFGTFCNLLGMHYLFDRPSEVYGIALYNRLPVANSLVVFRKHGGRYHESHSLNNLYKIDEMFFNV